MKRVRFLLLFFFLLAGHTYAAELPLPPFLPGYFRILLNNGDHPLAFVNQRETNGITQFVYLIGASETLSIEHFSGDAPACRAAFNNILGHVNQLITTNKGSFIEVTETETYAQLDLTNVSQTVFVFKVPQGVNIWSHSTAPNARKQLPLDFQSALEIVNRQRYEGALQEGNVSLGSWQKAIHSYAKDLLKAGNKREALPVLQNLLATSPFDYEAHFEFIENTSDLQAATNSAKAVFKNAENLDQISRAAKFLGIELPSADSIPFLSSNDTGLEVVLIPLPPCNPWLLENASRTFQRITDVPVKIRRLDKEWTWGVPERVARQRDIERILVQLAKENMSFTNWNRDRYVTALTNAVNSADALSKFQVQDLISKLDTEPGQYRVGLYVEKLSQLIAPNRSKDSRTMYVGITEANIYGDDDNFLFSLTSTTPQSHAGILSYCVMQGKATLSFDSQSRLVERIAKELVPAALKQLRIPRSTDPTCPYSYSSGVERLDQKTLNLSDGVKQALMKLRN